GRRADAAVRPAPAPAAAATTPRQLPPPLATQPNATSLLRQKCTAYIANLVGKTLGLAARDLDPTAPLEEYGLDSILVVQLTNALREVMDGIPSTLFFEVHTIDALVDHLLATHRDTLVRLVGLESTSDKVMA